MSLIQTCFYLRLYGSLITVRVPLYAVACTIFTPFFNAIYNQALVILQTIYVYTKQGNSSKKSVVYNKERFQIMSRL